MGARQKLNGAHLTGALIVHIHLLSRRRDLQRDIEGGGLAGCDVEIRLRECNKTFGVRPDRVCTRGHCNRESARSILLDVSRNSESWFSSVLVHSPICCC